MQKILVVEDDNGLNRAISYALHKEKYMVVSACCIKEAEEAYRKEPFHLALLDVNLPDGEGFTLCKWMKQQNNIPVLFLTARDLEAKNVRLHLRNFVCCANLYCTRVSC